MAQLCWQLYAMAPVHASSLTITPDNFKAALLTLPVIFTCDIVTLNIQRERLQSKVI